MSQHAHMLLFIKQISTYAMKGNGLGALDDANIYFTIKVSQSIELIHNEFAL